MSQILSHDGQGQDECALWAGAFCVCGNAAGGGRESLGGPAVLVFAVGLRGHQGCKPSQPAHRVGRGHSWGLRDSRGEKPQQKQRRSHGAGALISPSHPHPAPRPPARLAHPAAPGAGPRASQATPPPPTAKPVSRPKFLRCKS